MVLAQVRLFHVTGEKKIATDSMLVTAKPVQGIISQRKVPPKSNLICVISVTQIEYIIIS